MVCSNGYKLKYSVISELGLLKLVCPSNSCIASLGSVVPSLLIPCIKHFYPRQRRPPRHVGLVVQVSLANLCIARDRGDIFANAACSLTWHARMLSFI
jgi:hypothetical protein